MKWILASLLFSSVVWAGGSETGLNNGGDDLRYRFIMEGQRVIRFFEEQPAGDALLKRFSLNLSALKETLQIQRISVRTEELYDNHGSAVDALGSPGSIVINKNRWERYFDRELNITYLVFHEMLRSAGVNDDGYRISAVIDPFFLETLPRAAHKIELTPKDANSLRMLLRFMFRTSDMGPFAARALTCEHSSTSTSCELALPLPFNPQPLVYNKTFMAALVYQLLARYVRPIQHDGEFSLIWTAHEITCSDDTTCHFYTAPISNLDPVPAGDDSF